MTHRIAFILVFAFGAPLHAQFATPDPNAFSVALPKDRDALLHALANGATATSCLIEQTSLVCRCLTLADGTRIDSWENGSVAGVTRVEQGRTVWLEQNAAGEVAFSDGRIGFTASRKTDDTLTDLTFGEISMPVACGEKPSVVATATAVRMQWIDDDWRLEGYRDTFVSIPNASTKPASGFLPPTLRSDGDVFEADLAYFLGPLRSALVLNGSNRWVGLGVGVPTRRETEHHFIEFGGRYLFEDEELLPFAHGEFFIGGPLAHLSGSIEHPQSSQLSATRQLDRGRLFRDYSYSVIGTSLSGPAHGFQTTFGVLSDGDDDDVLMTADYSTSAKLGVLSVDLFGRHVGDQRDEADDRLLQSTTIGAKFSHAFSKRGALFEPAAILGTNFGVVPIDSGYDASATGLMIGQLHARLPIVGTFDAVQHRIVPHVTVGRDLAGFQQRFLRDGTTPFPFRRRSGFTYARAGIDHAIEQNTWTFETPIAAHLFWVPGNDARITPTATVAVKRDSASVEVTGFCETECGNLRFLAMARFDASRNVTVSYMLSDLTAAQTVQRLGRALSVGARVPIVWTQNLPFVLEPDWSHSAKLEWRSGDYHADATLLFDVSSERGGSIVGLKRTWPRLGWGLHARGGYEPFIDVWNASLGFSGNFVQAALR